MFKKEYISQMHMDAYYKEIIRKMTISNFKPDIVIGLLRGGADMAVKFSHYYDVPCEVVRWQLRDGEVSQTQQDYAKNIIIENRQKSILVVDDIFDSGESLKQFDQLAKTVSITGLLNYAVCIENLDVDEPNIDFSARQISRTDEDQWFVFPCEAWWI